MYTRDEILQHFTSYGITLDREQLMWLSLPDGYELKDIPISELIRYNYEYESERLAKYTVLPSEGLPPILLCKQYKSGYQVVDGYYRIAAQLAKGQSTVKAYVPIFKPRTLYHVSLELKIIDEFYPRVPEDMMVGENGQEERICVADSLEGCFSSAPWGGNVFGDTMMPADENGDYDPDKDIGCYFRVYEFSTEGVYSGHIRFPTEIHFFDYVLDAKIKGEYWLTESIPYTRTYLIYVTDWDEGCEDLLSYWDEKDIDNGLPYEEVWSGEVTTLIESLKYTVHEDDVLSFD